MKKEELVASRIPQELLEDLKKIEEIEHLDRSTALRRLLYSGIREWKLEYASKQYRENRITMEKAAEEAGVSVREMMEYLRQNKIPMQYDLEDFESDSKGIYQRQGKEKALFARESVNKVAKLGGTEKQLKMVSRRRTLKKN
jgi:predicted HTH domain antitoxin